MKRFSRLLIRLPLRFPTLLLARLTALLLAAALFMGAVGCRAEPSPPSSLLSSSPSSSSAASEPSSAGEDDESRQPSEPARFDWGTAGSTAESSGTVPRSAENRAGLNEKYDSEVVQDVRQKYGCTYMTLQDIPALDGLPCEETVWNWIQEARQELSAFYGCVDESATVAMGYLSIRLSLREPRQVQSGYEAPLAPAAVRTAVFDLETGEPLELADLFYEDVHYIETLNSRLRSHVPAENLKRPFTGFPADYPYFGLEMDFYGEGVPQLTLYSDCTNPFSYFECLQAPLALNRSPAGGYYYDVTYEELETDNGSKTMIPTVTFNDGAAPELDNAVNGAVQAMVPRLKSAAMVFYPYLFFLRGTFHLMYLERDYVMTGGGWYPAAAVPGCTLCLDPHTGQAVSLAEEIPDDRIPYYLELTGGLHPYIAGETEDFEGQSYAYNYTEIALKDYTPPDGSILSDYTEQYGIYYATLTEPSGRRLLAVFEDPSWQ